MESATAFETFSLRSRGTVSFMAFGISSDIDVFTFVLKELKSEFNLASVFADAPIKQSPIPLVQAGVAAPQAVSLSPQPLHTVD